jgi:hypothetical protein
MDQNPLCCDCCKDYSDEVTLLSELKNYDLFLQIIHCILVWLAYLLFIIIGVVITCCSYTVIILGKDWILVVYDTFMDI